MSGLERAIHKAGGVSALAALIGGTVKAQHVINWRNRGVPVERCAEIERATGGEVTREDLRPDIFDDSKPHKRAGAAT